MYLSTESITTHAIKYCSLKSADGAISSKDVIQTASDITYIFKNEFLPKNDEPLEEKVKKILAWVVNKGYGEETEDGRLLLKNDKKTKFLNHFMQNLLQAHIDSYLVVLYAIHCIMDSGIIIEQKKIVNELHLGIQEMYNRGAIQFMSSCLLDILNTAFGRYSEMGICQSSTYNSQVGGKIIYIKAKLTSKQKLEEVVQLLTVLSSASHKKEGLSIIEQEVNKVIQQSKGPMARL